MRLAVSRSHTQLLLLLLLLLHAALQALQHHLPIHKHIQLHGQLLSCAASKHGLPQRSRQWVATIRRCDWAREARGAHVLRGAAVLTCRQGSYASVDLAEWVSLSPLGWQWQ
jgi:hypothetical protein